MRIALLGLVLATAAIFSGSAIAANIRTMGPGIPFAFEENRGQSPRDFRFVQVLQNSGFSCDGLSARTSTLPSRVPEKLTFVGANPGCVSEIEDPLPSYTNFYRGVGSSASVENVRHYRTIRFRNVWPGVDVRYNAVSSGYTMTVQAASAAALAQVRLSGSSYGVSVHPSTGNVSSPVGVFAVAGPVAAVSSGEGNEVRFTSTGSAGNVSFTLTPTNLTPPPAPTVVPSLDFAVDPQGALYFVDSTTSYPQLDGRSETCTHRGLPDACPDVYVAKFDRNGVFQYLVYFQGDRFENAHQIESDAGGNIYVAGTTLSRDFVTTLGAYQATYRGPESAVVESRSYVGGDGFLAKLHGPTGGLIYSTLFGGSGEDSINSMRVDVFGRTYLGLGTRSQDLPRKGAQVESAPVCSQPQVASSPSTCFWFVSLDENGRELRYAQQASSRQFSLSAYGTLYYFTTASRSQDGNAYSTTHYTLWSDGSLRHSLSMENQVLLGLPGPDESLWAMRRIPGPDSTVLQSELVRLDPNGASPQVIRTGLPASLQIVAVDEHSNVWVSGNPQTTPDAPIAGCPGCDGIGMLDASGHLVFGTALPISLGRFRVNSGVLYAASNSIAHGAPTLTIVDRSLAPQPILVSISDVTAGILLLPGNVLALSGPLIGPEAEIYRPLDRNGRLATEVGGYSVLFNDRHAPILAASRDRLVVQVPLAQVTPWSTLTIHQNGKPFITRSLIATSARGPIILAGSNPPDPSFVIRNQDGTVNSAEQPAALGSVVTFLVAGVGNTDPPLVEGELTHSVLAKPSVTPAVSFSLGAPIAEVVSYQQEQNQPAGIMEMQIRLPRTAPGNDPLLNWLALFFLDPTGRFPATSQDPLRIHITQ